MAKKWSMCHGASKHCRLYIWRHIRRLENNDTSTVSLAAQVPYDALLLAADQLEEIGNQPVANLIRHVLTIEGNARRGRHADRAYQFKWSGKVLRKARTPSRQWPEFLA